MSASLRPTVHRGRAWYTGQAHERKAFHILIGSSNTAEAWTDGHSYIAFVNAKIYDRFLLPYIIGANT
ncbi:hypothetical protein [Chania multitudinisentens]|uniref:hypothetical protein n=1 Tax=Chania multitudinisentens TaxID=1639108 RepID=UPI0004666A67|nr:hypothetical protein [Chania multitudinisentens]